MPLTHPYFFHPIIFLRPMADHGPALPSCSITDLGQSMTNRIVLAMVGKVGGITSKCPPFLPYNKIPRHLLKSIRSYVKGTNIYVIRGGGATEGALKVSMGRHHVKSVPSQSMAKAA